MKIAIQGEPGAFSHEAALQMVPRSTIVPCARSAEVFDRVGRGSVGGAVIPIENSLAGSVAEHFDLLLSRDVFIQSEFPLRIVHKLIAAPGVHFTPGAGIRLCTIRRGNSLWINTSRLSRRSKCSATDPASEFSIGITAPPTDPRPTRSKTSADRAQGTIMQRGTMRQAAS